MHISRFHFTNLGGFYDQANFTSFRVFVLIWNLPKDLRKIDEHANRIITQHQHTFGNIFEFMFLGQSDYDYYRIRKQRTECWADWYCVKSVRIRSFSGPYLVRMQENGPKKLQIRTLFT